jgi:hypothetical protein
MRLGVSVLTLYALSLTEEHNPVIRSKQDPVSVCLTVLSAVAAVEFLSTVNSNFLSRVSCITN